MKTTEVVLITQNTKTPTNTTRFEKEAHHACFFLPGFGSLIRAKAANAKTINEQTKYIEHMLQ